MKNLKFLLSVSLVLFLSGCSVSNWNVGKSIKKEPTPTQTEQPKPARDKNAMHIDKIIYAWGSPTSERVNSGGNKVYVWENCKATGNYINECDESGCRTVPETSCCERAIITDSDGYTTNLKEAVNSCM